MVRKIAVNARRQPAVRLLGGPPFDGAFFATAFRDRVRSLCAALGNAVPVILLQLSDGRVLDLCHIEGLTARWMAVAAFRDNADCKEMDTVLIPYETIVRVTLSNREASDRRIGFQLEKSLPALAMEKK